LVKILPFLYFGLSLPPNRDIWTRFLSKRLEHSEKVKKYMVGKDHPKEFTPEIEWNLALAIRMVKAFYLRIHAALPEAEDVHGTGGLVEDAFQHCVRGGGHGKFRRKL
jgi:hypothetical protein